MSKMSGVKISGVPTGRVSIDLRPPALEAPGYFRTAPSGRGSVDATAGNAAPEQSAEKLGRADAAPEGAAENAAFAVCLKAYPDTNREFFSKL